MCASIEEAVAGAGIVCTTTGARQPILLGQWIAPGTHVNLVGAGAADAREADEALVKKSRYFVDFRASALAQAGELHAAFGSGTPQAEQFIRGEIGEVLNETKQGRTSDEDVTIYKSLGIAAQDLAVSHAIYGLRARGGAGNMGQHLAFWRNTSPWSLAFALLVACATVRAATQESFSVLSNGEIVGSLVATVEDGTVDINYRVDNNGRGPKLREHIVVGGDDVPTEWTVDGTSLFGGPVKERFSSHGGQARWESQADKGRITTKEPRLYAVNDGSPWSYGLYARALLRAPGQRLGAMPSGEMRLSKLEEATFGEGERAAKVGVYSITGINLTPEYVLLDADLKLFAQMRSGVEGILVRAGYEKEEQALATLSRSMALLQLERMQARFAHRFDRPVRIRNVKVFDPRSGQLSEPVSVIVFRDRIAAVAAETAQSSEKAGEEVVVDGAGGTLVPGLHDMHTHNAPWSGLFHLAAGVTTVRDMGNDNAALLDLTEKVDSGRLPGPRIVRAGLIEGRSPYSARIGVIPPDLPGGIQAVRWYADHGYVQIKLYNSLNPDWVKPLAAEAHRLGMRVSGHVPAFMSPDRAIRDGYDEINHVNQLMLGWLIAPGEDTRTPLRLTAMGERAWTLDLDSERVRTTLELFKEHHTALDTTAVILERLMLSRAGKVQPGDVALSGPHADRVSAISQAFLRESADARRMTSTTSSRCRRSSTPWECCIERACGCCPAPTTTPDSPCIASSSCMRLQEFPAAEVLRMATLDCDEYLHRDQSFGSIEAGKAGGLLPGPGRSDARHQRRAPSAAGDEGRLDLFPIRALRRRRHTPLCGSAGYDGAGSGDEIAAKRRGGAHSHCGHDDRRADHRARDDTASNPHRQASRCVHGDVCRDGVDRCGRSGAGYDFFHGLRARRRS